MKTLTLGKTGLVVTKTAMGCLPVQRCDKDYAVKLLQAAYDGGIRYFDTANAYTDSEEKIGLALSDVRDQIVISTKSAARDKAGVLAHIENSLKMMKTDYIDLFQFHHVPYVPDPNDPDGAYAGALEAKKRGVKLVTINAQKFAKKVPKNFKWRHSSKLDINDLADIAIDNHVPYPDAILKVPGLNEEITPTATILTCFTINCLMSETIRLMVEKGGKPEIWVSNNIPNCDEHNKPIHDKYRHRVHHLYPVW